MNFIIIILLKTYRFQRIPLLKKVWYKFYRLVLESPVKPVKIKIHNFKAIQPSTYTYPFTARSFKTFNNPLIECVYQTSKNKQGKINVVDIGAAIGDTVFLLKANCNEMINTIYCIDGDDEFFEYLKKNMAPFDDVKCYHTILASSNSEVNNLVRIHGGTASAQGSKRISALTFDSWVKESGLGELDVLKIDVDGFDGKVLRGAVNALSKFKPTVIFEWHPILYEKTNSDYQEPFEVLKEAGYDRFIWFTKYGSFSHFTYFPEKNYLDEFANICCHNTFDADLHYDVVAIHQNSNPSIFDFANSEYSRHKKSFF